MAQAVAEVPEAQAEGRIKSIYDDIKATFRVPYVAQVFLELATQPDYLQTAWTALKPNVQIVFFERQADALRRSAVAAGASFGSPPTAAESVSGTLNTLHYATPKYFLATAVLRAATAGSQPQMLVLPPEDKRRIPPGAPPDMQPLTLDGAREVDETVPATVGEVGSEQADFEPGGELRGLSGTPDYYQTALTALKSLAGRPEYSAALRSLRLTAERTVTALPFRMDIAPHSLRHSGLTEGEIDDVREILTRCYAAGASSLLTTAFLATGVNGREAASASPFPLPAQDS